MPLSRRHTVLGLFPGLPLLGCAADVGSRAPEVPRGRPRGPDDEAYWGVVRAAYLRPEGFINLENGFFSKAADPVLRRHAALQEHVNRQAAWYMRREQSARIEAVRARLAAFAGVDPGELALVRNTTEAMNVVLQGVPLARGDEVIMSDQDYGSMVGILRHLERTRGVVPRVAQLPLDPARDDELVQAYARLVTPRTRLALLTQIIHLTGQVLPVPKIAAALRGRGVPVVVDGAHAFAQLPLTIPALGCDFFGASLHKWLGAPLGSGLLWMRREHIPRVTPLFADVDREPSDIRRFEHVGTRPSYDLEAILAAIEFHESIGAEPKRARLLYLRQRWVRAVRGAPGVRVLSPTEDARACAIATVAVDGLTPDELAARLLERHGVYTVAIRHPVINGVRVSVHLYNTPAEVDTLAHALRSLGAEA